MSRVLVRLTTNLNILEERLFPKEVALYSFIAESGFFAVTFAEISSLIKVRWPKPFFFATFFFGGKRMKKVEGQSFDVIRGNTKTLENLNCILKSLLITNKTI